MTGRLELPEILARVERYYSEKLEAHGPTPAGADWSSAESQTLRFEQLLKLCPGEWAASMNDYGCGYGALLDHLRGAGFSGPYGGLDVSPPMVAAAARLHEGWRDCRFVTDESQMAAADYAFASGVLNVRLDVDRETWSGYVRHVLAGLDRLSRKGFAFNALTAHADPERMRPDLYYADPGALFDHCVQTSSRRVALLHDYPLYEFTILVRK